MIRITRIISPPPEHLPKWPEYLPIHWCCRSMCTFIHETCFPCGSTYILATHRKTFRIMESHLVKLRLCFVSIIFLIIFPKPPGLYRFTTIAENCVLSLLSHHFRLGAQTHQTIKKKNLPKTNNISLKGVLSSAHLIFLHMRK